MQVIDITTERVDKKTACGHLTLDNDQTVMWTVEVGSRWEAVVEFFPADKQVNHDDIIAHQGLLINAVAIEAIAKL